MKNAWYIILLVLQFSTYAQTALLEHKVVLTESRFVLDGTTNVNTFTCKLIQGYGQKPVNVITTSRSNNIVFEGLAFQYPVETFNCGLEAMNQDLHQTLNADSYPMFGLKIKEIIIKEQAQEVERLFVLAHVVITLAGVSREITITDGQVINHTARSLTLSGSQLLKLPDFGLKAPTKFFGMIKVDETLSVHFQLDMEVDTLQEN
ncbi:MAG: hypothetical protein ACJAVY_002319 [Marinoscillum sp.]